MTRKILVTITMLLSICYVFGADGDYAVSNIPEALLKDAHVVKRMEDIRFEVLDLGRSRLYHKYALTVLNENGDKYAVEVVGYDKLREFKSMEGNLYDANGKKIRSLKKSEIKDLSATDDISLMDDNRIKVHGFFHRLYPYTIEYEIVVQYNYNMFFPAWSPLGGENMSVMQSAMTLVVPSDFAIRYKAFNYKTVPDKKTEKGRDTYRWELNNLEAIQLEYASPNWSDIMPVVYLGPVQFEFEKYTGDMSSWEGLGKFIFTLNQGRDKLPDNVKQTVHQLTDGMNNDKEKVLKLYDYLQQNTRYISVQLGIGGWQTFDATYVAQRKYGDCKALSNYMFSLLKEAGIKSHYTLIKNGNGQPHFLEDFPSSQFNHIILCVPLKADTMWLECTSQTVAPGYLGGSNANRPVLLIDEDGGKLVKTPRYGIDQNLQIRKASGKLSENGELNVEINTHYTAVQQDYLHGMIHQLSKDKQLEYLKKNIDLPHYDVAKFEYKESKTAIPAIDEHLELNALNYASVTGKRLFINPNIITRSSVKLKSDDKRKYPVSLNFEYRDIDTTVIEIPAGYQVENMPAPVKIESKFGTYIASVDVQADKMIYYRSIEKFSGRFPPSDYNELVKFYDQLYKADRSRVVLVKKEG
ncbi:DUF3857 and transglutaminase domain-containing protein [Agriterribacter sp.]|uniref:DUF3857 domain-containing transglutaminase family protein n=1 Tax=Agriterribacter sp. TaxID=2821509 RepID=UPI002C0098EF|nr:DUF3857 and transglutaminase domain-containing protein [Agriterribacter sp.]HRO47806.1 DUF3857 and transglutaminase domain-containing protein [Agriterribacter sp.]HRQ18924.1 DUF3857 and transglutaminase domain-containing protein [Agriterribacter sp.]